MLYVCYLRCKIQAALSPIENKFKAAASEALKSTSVGGELIRLWIRIMATVTVLATAKDHVKPTLRHWTQALHGCSELDTSAPSQGDATSTCFTQNSLQKHCIL
jgi:hypothetical protein